jgi:hypothetical protein
MMRDPRPILKELASLGKEALSLVDGVIESAHDEDPEVVALKVRAAGKAAIAAAKAYLEVQVEAKRRGKTL